MMSRLLNRLRYSVLRRKKRKLLAEFSADPLMRDVRALIASEPCESVVQYLTEATLAALDDPRFNGPWRAHLRSEARAAVLELMEASFPPNIVKRVFLNVDAAEAAR